MSNFNYEESDTKVIGEMPDGEQVVFDSVEDYEDAYYDAVFESCDGFCPDYECLEV